MKKTGVGRQKKLSEFQELCVDFIRAGKGYLKKIYFIFQIKQIYTVFPKKGRTVTDYITENGPEPSGCNEIPVPNECTDGTPALSKKKKKSLDLCHDNKEDLLKAMLSVKEKNGAAEVTKNHLEAYFTLLKVIEKEKNMSEFFVHVQFHSFFIYFLHWRDFSKLFSRFVTVGNQPLAEHNR